MGSPNIMLIILRSSVRRANEHESVLTIIPGNGDGSRVPSPTTHGVIRDERWRRVTKVERSRDRRSAAKTKGSADVGRHYRGRLFHLSYIRARHHEVIFHDGALFPPLLSSLMVITIYHPEVASRPPGRPARARAGLFVTCARVRACACVRTRITVFTGRGLRPFVVPRPWYQSGERAQT